MERSAPYALIAAFVLAGLAVGAGLLVWLNDYDPGRRVTTYAVVFEDVSGLSLASEVRYNGLPVGEVATMTLDPAGTGLIRVELEVQADVPVRQGAVARLSTQGVTGVAVVALEGGDPDAPPLPLGPQGLPVLEAGRGAIDTLADEAPALLAEARVLIADLRGFATPENAERVANVLADLERGAAGLGELGTLAEDLGGIGRDLTPAVRGLPETLARIEGAATEAEALAAALRATVEARAGPLATAAEDALAGITAAAATGRARLEEAEALVADLSEASAAAARLAQGAEPVLADIGRLTTQAGPFVDDAAALTLSLREGVPALLDNGTALAASLRPTADRLPALTDSASAALGEVTAAAGEGRARLEEAAPLVAATTDAAETLAATARDAQRLAVTAETVLTELRPGLSDASALALSLREGVPPLLDDAAATVASLRDSVPPVMEDAAAIAASLRPAADRLPTLAEGASAALGEVTAAASEGRARLEEAAPMVTAATEAAQTLAATAQDAQRLAARAETTLTRIGPVVDDAAALTLSLRDSVPPVMEDAAAIAASLRPAADRLPTLAEGASAALGEVTAAASEGRARLEEAAPMVTAATEAAQTLAVTAQDAQRLAASAETTLTRIGPVVDDVAAASTSLREDLPPALAELRRAAETVGASVTDRLPGLADRADTALEAAAGAARAVETASDEVGTVAADIAPTVRELASAGTSLAVSAETLAARSGPLIDEIALLVTEARGAVTATRSAVEQAGGILSDFGRAAPALDRALRETAGAAEAVNSLARRLSRDPSILIRGR